MRTGSSPIFQPISIGISKTRRLLIPHWFVLSGVAIGKSRIAAYEMTIKGIAISGIVIERWSDLRVKVVRKSEPRAYLPR